MSAVVTKIEEKRKKSEREARPGLPIIDATPGMLHHAFDASVAALSASANVFARDSVLVKMSECGTVTPLDPDTVRIELSRVANFTRTGEKVVVIDPPTDIARAICSAGAYPAAKALEAITHHPVMLPDGTLSRPGYDHRNKFFGLFDPAKFNIPDVPNAQDVSNSLGLLLNVLQTFDTAQGYDAGAAIAAMLTAVSRPTLRTAPLFLISAPVAGTGKGMLARSIALFSNPVEPPASTLPENIDEIKKELVSRLLSGRQVIFFDEIAGCEIDSADLRTLATSERFGGRILGQTRDINLSTKTLVLLTGNNVTPSADTARRVVEVRLQPSCESPSLRHFDFDPISFIKENREKLVCAALTIQRHYFKSGSPKLDVPPTGSFEEWDAAVRLPVIHALGADFDPATRMQQSIKTDPRKNELVALVAAWYAALGQEKITAGEVVEKVTSGIATPREKALRGALADVAGGRSGGDLSPRSIGKYMQKNRDRIAGGYTIVDGGLRDGRQRWQVIKTD